MRIRPGALWRAARRALSRNEWAIRLLRLPRPEAAHGAAGLVMVQIDGLSESQFRVAVESGNMPFLNRLLHRERYRLHTHYSGIPSNTPAVQGELFYGVKTCVPAFCYMDRKSGRVFKMYESAAAAEVERRLEREGGPGLLKDGSSYSNVFRGGAQEAHFCAAKHGWGALFCSTNPLAMPLILLMYADIFVRTTVLFLVELALSLFDCPRGALRFRQWRKEIEFIPSRVGVCVLLRELVTVGAQIDIARGMPVIHLNLLGYDEQSHRRGPTSRFAHWSLRGIDDSIARLWRSIRRTGARHYDLWVYSDHGQENTRAYPQVEGKTIERAVSDVFGAAARVLDGSGCCTLDRGRPVFLSEKEEETDPEPAPPPESLASSLVVTAMGPLGHIYSPRGLDPAEKEILGKALAESAGVPLVLSAAAQGKAHAWTKTGRFTLPEDAEAVLGAAHPFLLETARDLTSLCHHPDAGDFLLLGWRHGTDTLTFPVENGSHAGAGAEETRGFALLTADAPLPDKNAAYLRPLDLREAALRFLGRSDSGHFFTRPKNAVAPPPRALRLMTYNVHGCAGMDGRLSPERIARVIARHDPDIVALQELDAGRPRSGHVDQAAEIALKLEMEFHFHPTFILEDGKYGNAIFSRYPMRLVRMGALPRARKDYEPRGALWVSIDLAGTQVQFINSHLSVWPGERLLQAEALAGPEWLGNPALTGPVILCGDMNALPGSPAYRKINAVLRDAQLHLNEHQPTNTWFGWYPVGRIDHVFLGAGLEVTSIRVPTTELEKNASDHLPLVVGLRVPETASEEAPGPAEPSARPWVIRKDPATGEPHLEKESREKPR
ncbi:MAG TPA: endonuclease/exonuclease/phosphatase family protein [Candidatus Eisenbacteria bacterium]|nr:endonuclease/exonuclease/phosphatase family protein [Candidatus Eisenbacteria bacterium]